ncbi:hypothetical protein AUK11_00160 [bacterium CG2_30_37_16]|nr:MAG: hypothetical protein AUK11_00160 [bacterium CG2_30_37_16]
MAQKKSYSKKRPSRPRPKSRPKSSYKSSSRKKSSYKGKKKSSSSCVVFGLALLSPIIYFLVS